MKHFFRRTILPGEKFRTGSKLKRRMPYFAGLAVLFGIGLPTAMTLAVDVIQYAKSNVLETVSNLVYSQ